MLWIKRVLLLLVSLFFLLQNSFQHATAKSLDISPNFNPISVKTLKNIGPVNLPEISVRARESGIKPAFLKNVNLKLKEKVNWLTDEQSQIIRENTENGKIDENLVNFVKPGEIYVDPHSLLAIKFAKDESGSLTIMEADDDVVEDISIAEQKVFLNEANIVRVTPGIKAVSMQKKSATLQGTGFTFYFDENQKLPGYDKEGKLIEIALQGFIILDAPSVEVRYSKNSGYRFIFSASQNSQVNVKFHADLKKDVKIPLYEYSIPAQGCKIAIGFYLVLGVDGSISLAYSLTQNATIKAGLHGDTSYFIPTSFNTVKELDFKLNSDNISLTANLKGEASILAEVFFEVLNKGNLVIDSKIGLLLDAKSNFQGGGGDYLSVKGDGFVRLTAKIKVKSFDKSKDFYEYRYSIFNYTKERASNYRISITDTCAFNDIIKGQIIEDLHPYADKEVNLKVFTNSGEEKIINTKTDKNGNFSIRYDLKKGDYVSVKIPGTNKFSEPKEASFPYDQVFIEKADYLQNVVKGYVNATEKTPKYNGSIYVIVERTNNIPIHPTENLSVPVTYAQKFQVQVINGGFQLSNQDIRPFDKVYAVLEREGFVISSNKIEPDGINLAVDGGYIQEDDKLSSSNSVVIFSYEGTTPPHISNPYLFVKVDYPYSKKKGETSQTKEFRLNVKNIQGAKQSISDTGPWEIELGNYMEQLTSSFEKFKGTYSDSSGNIKYHVIEMVTFFSEGKRFEYVNLAKKSDDERKKSILGYVDKNKPFNKNIHNEGITTLAPFVNVAPISAKNFTADLLINYYNLPVSTTPTYSRNVKFSVLNERQKIDSGIRETMIIWDKNSKTKILRNKEFKQDDFERYDLEDYVPELKDIKFVQKSIVAVNGILCNHWEKYLKVNQSTEIKIEIFTSKETNLPVKVVFYDGSLQKVELIFSNWKKVNEKI